MVAFGRRVQHDPRSWAFPAQRATAKTVLWEHKAPILDQGTLGCCTGDALAQCLNTEAFTPCRPNGAYLQQADAVKLYSLATGLDDFAGQYPPNDTGSSGLAVCKAGRKLGYLSGYTHTFGWTHVAEALAVSPLIVGSLWTESMMETDSDGFVHAKGATVGGHEYLLLGMSEGQYVTCLNSWSDSWGDRGRFRMTVTDFTKLLARQGDGTVPIGKPVAPTPTPAPTAEQTCCDKLEKIKAIIDGSP